MESARLRAIPSLLALVAFTAVSLLAWLATRGAAGKEFFSVAAVVIPVLLLARAVETNPLGLWRRQFPHAACAAQWWEWIRYGADIFVLVAILLGEAIAIVETGTLAEKSFNFPLVGGALAAGFVLVAVSAIGVRPQARINGSVTSQRIGKKTVLVSVGVGNIFGDKDSFPLLNFLVPEDVEVLEVGPNGKAGKRVRTLTSQDTLTIGGASEKVRYPSAFIDLPRGQSAVTQYILRSARESTPVVLKLSDADAAHGGLRLHANVG